MSATASPRGAKVITWITTAGRTLLDLLYPPRCPGCGAIGVAFCAECQSAIEPLPAPACPRCGHPTETARLCPTCQRTPSALDHIAAPPYSTTRCARRSTN